MSVERTEDKTRAVAEPEDWRAVRCDRGAFAVIEVRVENAAMLEFIPPEMTAGYLAAVRPG